MKLKYKKIVLLITTFTMMIGCVVFSIISPTGSSDGNSQTKETEAENTNEVLEQESKDGVEDSKEGTVVTEGQDVENTETVKNTENQEILLEKSTNEQINQLIADYFDASVACNMETLETLVNDVSVLDKDELKVKYELVDSIENVECYLAKGLPEGKYLVYVYSEVKFKNVATMAPGLSRLSVVTTTDGDYIIFFGADSEIEQFAERADVSASVQELVQKVSLKMEEAVSSDADLKAVNEKMTGTDEQKEEKKEETDEEPKETE